MVIGKFEVTGNVKSNYEVVRMTFLRGVMITAIVFTGNGGKGGRSHGRMERKCREVEGEVRNVP